MRPESAFVLKESGKMFLEPYMEQLPSLFVSYFKNILKVGYEIPRLEYYMSHGEYTGQRVHCLKIIKKMILFYVQSVSQASNKRYNLGCAEIQCRRHSFLLFVIKANKKK